MPLVLLAVSLDNYFSLFSLFLPASSFCLSPSHVIFSCISFSAVFPPMAIFDMQRADQCNVILELSLLIITAVLSYQTVLCNHRIACVGRDLQGYLVPVPCPWDTFQQTRLLEALTNLTLDIYTPYTLDFWASVLQHAACFIGVGSCIYWSSVSLLLYWSMFTPTLMS